MKYYHQAGLKPLFAIDWHKTLLPR